MRSNGERARSASLAQVGGFRPPEEELTSWVGKVAVARPGEQWPKSGGAPMLALLQLVVHELPVVPEQLRDVELVTLFVGPWELPVDEPNGTNWCLRAYPSLEALATLSEPAPARAADAKRRKGEPGVLAAFPVRWHEVADDADEPHDGLKVGGWPREVQGDVEWRENGELVEDVDFVLQVDSDEKTGFEVGHGGVLHVGRRRSTGSWHCSWQSL